ncbi:MAG TPA: type II toxin-antitoxin system VapC family toxin [Tepidisphaeraceae bacterium]|jgi:PIN domain nuclease of toxin-antitoxin system
MRLLLDTNVFLRMMTDETLLSPVAKAALADRGNELWVSAVSAWEIAIKTAIGKIRLSDPIELFISDGMRKAKAIELPIRAAHAVRVAALPLHHNDPFDRLLLAQAQVESLTIVTSDRQFAPYGLPIIW